MYVADLKPLKRHFATHYYGRRAELECRRCHRWWTTSRDRAADPRVFWPREDPRRSRPTTGAALERHWAKPHSAPAIR